MQVSKTTHLTIYEYIIALIATITVTPILSSRIPTVVNAAFFATWLLLVLIREKGKIVLSRLQISMLLSASILILIILLYKIIGYSTAEIGNCFNQIMFLLGIFPIVYLKNHSSVEKRKKLFWIIWVVSFANVLDNIRLCIIYPNASVYAVNLNWYSYLRNTNVGSTVFNTYVLFYYSICLMLFTSISNRVPKLLFGVSSIVSGIYLVFFGLRASVVILMGVATIALIISRNSKVNSRSSYISIFALFIIGVLFICFYNTILMSILRILPESRLTSRLAELSQISISGLDETAFSGRYGLIQESLRTFESNFRSILIGIGDHRSSGGYAGFILSGIGGHSELIDTLARFGLIGFSALATAMISFGIFLKDWFRPTKCSQQIIIIFILLIVCMGIKSFFYPRIGVVTFIMLPLSRDICIEEEILSQC